MLDLKRIIEETDRYNLHSHTEFCDGHAPMAEMALAAAAKGFEVWGFSPHAPVAVESPCNMPAEDVEEYKKGVEAARKAHPEMLFLAGMEVDYIDEDQGPASPWVKAYGLDYIIGSVHFIPNQLDVPYDIDGDPERFRERVQTVFARDLDYIVRTFWQQTRDMIAAGGIDIIGHIDKIARNASVIRPRIEQEPEYRRLADQTIDEAIKSGMAIEINTKQRPTARRYFPHPRFWARIARAGVPMPINSDAHTPAAVDLARTDARHLLTAIVTLDNDPAATLVVVSADGVVHKFANPGVKDLYTLFTERPELLRGATVADRIVGRGAAALLCMGGVRQVYSDVVSEAALETFATTPAVFVDYDRITPGVINRTGDGMCPVEAVTAHTVSPADCLPLITAFMQKKG